ncbi:MAG: transposase family protein [Planctomycetaceae bacterium]
MWHGGRQLVQRHFANVTDPRVDRGHNHDLLEMVFMADRDHLWGRRLGGCRAVCQVKWDWFRQYLELPHGVPSHDTFGRVFAGLDTGEFSPPCIGGSISSPDRCRTGDRDRRENEGSF